jgi:hypothetical protein
MIWYKRSFSTDISPRAWQIMLFVRTLKTTEKINPVIFNNYFLNITDNIIQQIFTQTTSNIDTTKNFKHYLNLTKGPFPKIIFNWKCTITSIIISVTTNLVCYSTTLDGCQLEYRFAVD